MALKTEEIERQLDRVLSFFSRVDAKATALFAINSALLAVAGTRVRAEHIEHWYVFLPAILATSAVAVSLVFLYLGSFPHLKGGEGSLIYFGAIAKRTETQYSSEFLAATDDQRKKDLLCQIWRNSEILSVKFWAVKWAFIWTAVSLAPWCWFLTASSWTVSD